MKKLCVIGGGAAGMMAAYFGAMGGGSVTLIEKNGFCGKKINITGKGRCNLTNLCDVADFLKNVPVNPRFLYKALNSLDPETTMTLFESFGVPLKVERGRRVFPVSDKAADVSAALHKACRDGGVRVLYAKVRGISIKDGAVSGVLLSDGSTLQCDACVVATGGASYPKTGSDGDGYRFAREAGLVVTRLLPSLVPLTSADRGCARMQGLSLRNVALRICEKASGKTVYEDFGEMMFTHFGLTGPLILSASAHVPDITPGKYEAVIDLKPALDRKTLDTRLLHDFAKFNNRDFANSLGELLPQKMIPIVVERSGIPAHKKVNSITKEERGALCELLKAFRVPLDGFRPINEAIITKGGVAVEQIRPGTMEAKSVSGLYFAGEVLDLDAYTGGFNLQIAFSTAVLAGENAAMGV